jgi:hypothetical protein
VNNERPAAKPSPPPRGKPPASGSQPPQRRPIQFSLTTLLVLMAVFSLASAPAYYLMRGQEGSQGMQLVGMIVLLTGPMFLAIVASLVMATLGWWNKR